MIDPNVRSGLAGDPAPAHKLGAADLVPKLPKAPASPLPDPLQNPLAEELRAEENPFTTSDWRMRSYAWAGYTLRFVLIFGAVFTVVQFLAAREEKRVERALQLAETWERPEYQDAQKALRDRLADLNARYASLLGSDPSAEELDVYYDRIGQEAMTAEGGAAPLAEFRERFDRIVYFLNRVSFCVEENMCSAEVSDAYFGDYAQSFWNYFGGYVQAQRRRGAPNYAKPIESFVARRQDAEPEAPETPPPPAGVAPVAQAPGAAAPQPTSGTP
ncbi:MAG TPA: hypothetical protein VGN97_23200 [Mesorhizobium sp.]|jgi:hypothetical protein|nr:hypothetical protein [Mesorhizobium sp.]